VVKDCPHCGADLGVNHRWAIGIEIRGVYDGTLFYQCPSCGGRWHRFPEGDRLRARAEPFVNREKP
jgi:Zn-finger nucleic acid-binding protein